MTAIKTSWAMSNALTLAECVDLVNGAGMPDQMAGQYAYEAQTESGYPICEDALIVHLDVLCDAGAHFDYCAAIAHGMMLAKDEEEGAE